MAGMIARVLAEHGVTRCLAVPESLQGNSEIASRPRERVGRVFLVQCATLTKALAVKTI